MRIFQLLPAFAYGDAIGNDVLAMRKLIKKMGYKTHIYASLVDKRLNAFASEVNELKNVRADDVILYHYATGSELNLSICEFECRKIMVYHNITPAPYFKEYSSTAYQVVKEGREQLRARKDEFDYCLAVSEYNKQDLLNAGFTCDIDVLPILIPFEDYARDPDESVIKTYDDHWTNLLFVGRIAPNKKHEDIIKVFYYYKKYVNPNSRLFFVGSHQGMETYYNRLKDYIEALELDDVIFPGHISFNAVLSYYKLADVFLCMSEHEGFCVPLVEAMYFDIPIVAYDSSAIPYTMAGSGIVTSSKEPAFWAAIIDKIINDEKMRNELIQGQKRRLKDFSYEVVSESFKEYMKMFLNRAVK